MSKQYELGGTLVIPEDGMSDSLYRLTGSMCKRRLRKILRKAFGVSVKQDQLTVIKHLFFPNKPIDMQAFITAVEEDYEATKDNASQGCAG